MPVGSGFAFEMGVIYAVRAMSYYSHGYGGGRRRKSAGEIVVRLIIIGVLIFIVNRWFFRSQSKTDPASPRGAPAEVAVDERESVAIRDELRPSTQPVGMEAIGVVILVDTSGSMNESVKQQSGERVVKMAAAKAAVDELIETTARLKQERVKLPVLLAVSEFSEREDRVGVRPVVPLGPPQPSAARAAVQAMTPEGGTPIGSAIIAAKRQLDESGASRQHILVVTDGANTAGPRPEAVLQVMQSDTQFMPASIYFVAFDIDARTFDPVKAHGATVLPAASPEALRQALEGIMTERILVE